MNYAINYVAINQHSVTSYSNQYNWKGGQTFAQPIWFYFIQLNTVTLICLKNITLSSFL